MVKNGQVHYVPLEAILLSKLGAGGQSIGSSAAIVLLDWFEVDQEVILVMEHPVPCVDLLKYIKSHSGPSGSLREDDAKVIVTQLLDALIEIRSKGVVHRDLKPENILIQTGSDGLRVRVIDFGCGTTWAPGVYNEVA
ncbi:hypothetical protein LDENG_00190090, partial [Lucifuga dentata]